MLDVLNLQFRVGCSRLPAGPAMLGTGFDYTPARSTTTPSAIAMGRTPCSGADAPFGSAPARLPVGARRTNWGAFASAGSLDQATGSHGRCAATTTQGSITTKNLQTRWRAWPLPLTKATPTTRRPWLAFRFALAMEGTDDPRLVATGFKAPLLDESKPVSDGGC